ncbi:hypothetical protein K443DRAFT_673449 [Laccaria amethystina LaAM-08-1]|uniref:Unplaced genomic scaffold K443scaffold_12, whole genome shotgun sequence n=1 Tax=Laccaria amethystina LaAM-08-1 TaxID=1095629 RepID=A0A0C9XRD1_9AGAR|nr:hypothetical protein K443DRAFT_673449 [Laccaria amethystina LaAM-08-1]
MLHPAYLNSPFPCLASSLLAIPNFPMLRCSTPATLDASGISHRKFWKGASLAHSGSDAASEDSPPRVWPMLSKHKSLKIF